MSQDLLDLVGLDNDVAARRYVSDDLLSEPDVLVVGDMSLDRLSDGRPSFLLQGFLFSQLQHRVLVGHLVLDEAPDESGLDSENLCYVLLAHVSSLDQLGHELELLNGYVFLAATPLTGSMESSFEAIMENEGLAQSTLFLASSVQLGLLLLWLLCILSIIVSNVRNGKLCSLLKLLF